MYWSKYWFFVVLIVLIVAAVMWFRSDTYKEKRAAYIAEEEARMRAEALYEEQLVKDAYALCLKYHTEKNCKKKEVLEEYAVALCKSRNADIANECDDGFNLIEVIVFLNLSGVDVGVDLLGTRTLQRTMGLIP